jgi:hypothetical protein
MAEDEALRSLLKAITAAWTEGRFDDLNDHFDENIVFIAPGFEARAEGRNACVQGYRDFMTQATIDEYRESEPAIDVWGDTGVASYRWEMAWTMNGQSSRESGQDLFVFARHAGRWRAVWRTMIVPSA